ALFLCPTLATSRARPPLPGGERVGVRGARWRLGEKVSGRCLALEQAPQAHLRYFPGRRGSRSARRDSRTAPKLSFGPPPPRLPPHVAPLRFRGWASNPTQQNRRCTRRWFSAA